MKRRICCLVFLLSAFFVTLAVGAETPFRDDEDWGEIAPEGLAPFYAAQFYRPAQAALRSNAPQPVAQLHDMAFRGDFQALAALVVIARLHEQQDKVSAGHALVGDDWWLYFLGDKAMQGDVEAQSVLSVIMRLRERQGDTSAIFDNSGITGWNNSATILRNTPIKRWQHWISSSACANSRFSPWRQMFPPNSGKTGCIVCWESRKAAIRWEQSPNQ